MHLRLTYRCKLHYWWVHRTKRLSIFILVVVVVVVVYLKSISPYPKLIYILQTTHIQLRFWEWMCLKREWNLIEIRSMELIDDDFALVKVMVWRHMGTDIFMENVPSHDSLVIYNAVCNPGKPWEDLGRSPIFSTCRPREYMLQHAQKFWPMEQNKLKSQVYRLKHLGYHWVFISCNI